MNEKEAKQHARDMKTVERAVSDQSERNYDPPVKGWEIFASDDRIHDKQVYDAAYGEARKHNS